MLRHRVVMQLLLLNRSALGRLRSYEVFQELCSMVNWLSGFIGIAIVYIPIEVPLDRLI